jgi:hypothetical protein
VPRGGGHHIGLRQPCTVPTAAVEALAPAHVFELPLIPHQQPRIGRHSGQRRQHKGQRRGDGGPAA